MASLPSWQPSPRPSGSLGRHWGGVRAAAQDRGTSAPHCRRVLGSQAPRTGSQQAGWPPSGFGRPHLLPKAVTGRRTCALGTERPLPFWGGPLPTVCEPGGCLPGWKQPHRYMTRVTLPPAFADGVPACACCPNRVTSSGPFSLRSISASHSSPCVLPMKAHQRPPCLCLRCWGAGTPSPGSSTTPHKAEGPT